MFEHLSSKPAFLSWTRNLFWAPRESQIVSALYIKRLAKSCFSVLVTCFHFPIGTVILSKSHFKRIEQIVMASEKKFLLQVAHKGSLAHKNLLNLLGPTTWLQSPLCGLRGHGGFAVHLCELPDTLCTLKCCRKNGWSCDKDSGY